MMNKRDREALDRHITGNYGEDSVAIGLADHHIEVTAPVKVPLDRIAYTLCAALEGGSTYWCESVMVTEFGGYEYAHEAIAAGAPWTFKVFEEDGYLPPAKTLTEALNLLAKQYPRDFGDLMGETEDAETGDRLFQLLCFGEIVYG